eukprot:UN01264
MPKSFVMPRWYRDPRIPNWGRVLFRNAWGMTRIVFKRYGFRKHRPLFKRMIWRPLNRIPTWRHLMFAKNHLKKNIWFVTKKSGVNPFRRLTKLIYSYYYPWSQGLHILGRRGPLLPIRVTGQTSSGEEFWKMKGHPNPDTFAFDVRQYKMPLKQAQEILNIGTHNFYPRVVDRNFARIF